MRYLLLLAAMPVLAGSQARAADRSVEFGVSGGVLFTDPLEVLGSTWTVVPKVGYWFNPTLAAELDLGFAMGETRIGDPDTKPYTGLTPRVGMLGRVFEDQPVNLLLGAGVGIFAKRVADEGALGLPVDGFDVDFLGAAGPGFAIPFGDSGIALRSDVRFALNLGTENYQNRGDAFLNWEWTGGIVFGMPGASDADHDGIVDDDDQCAQDAEDVDAFQDEDGCPDADNDNDSVTDVADQCPNEAEDIDGFEDPNGCPEADNDKDQILDADDNCPDEAGIAAFDGCPDTDGDGMADADDECPEEAGEDIAGGCPDGDKDLVPDYRDECPEVAAPEGINPIRSDGCVHRVFITKKALVITETIQFDTGKATIKAASTDLLIDIATALQKYPGLKRLQIEGHTDDKGDDAANLTLSQERADSVKAWLVEKGNIAAARLEAKGFGETKPIADNATPQGREANRRVEFQILEEDVGKKLKKALKDKPL